VKQDSETAPRKTRSKVSVVKKFSDLCELGGSVVNTSLQKPRNNQKNKLLKGFGEPVASYRLSLG
jgi:hypothetical protein